MRIPTIALALAAAAGPLAAQEPVPPSVPQSLSLADAVDIAVQHNPTFRQTANDHGPAAWGVRNAYASFLPTFSVGAGLNYTGSGSQNFLNQQFTQSSSTIGSSYSLGLNWQLSGQTLTQPGVAKAQLHAADAAIDGARINLRSAVEQQYLAVLQAQAQVDLAQTQLKRNEEYLRLANARYQVGQATMLDVRQAQVAKGQSQVALLQAQQLVTVEKLRLFQQMGVPAPDDPSVVSLTDTFAVLEPTWKLHDLLAEAEAHNPDLGALRARESSAHWSEKAAKSQYLPSISVSAGWSGFTQQYTNVDPIIANAQASAQSNIQQCQYTNDHWANSAADQADCSLLAFTAQQAQQLRDANSVFPFSFTRQPFSARLSISLPIFTQFGRPSQVAQASANAEDAAEAVEARRLQVRTDVSQAYYTLMTAYQTIGIQDTNRTAAREQLRLATERYRVGSGTFFELLDAQVAAQQAEADYINAVYGYHKSVAALEAAVGRSLR